MVYDCEDCVFPIIEGKSHDQVHCYLLEGLCILQDCNSVEWGFSLMCNDFVLLAGRTSFNVVYNPGIHTWPLVDFFCFPYCFVPSWVSCCHMIMGVKHNGP